MCESPARSNTHRALADILCRNLMVDSFIANAEVDEYASLPPCVVRPC